MTLERILGGGCNPPFPSTPMRRRSRGRAPRRQRRARCDGRARACDVCCVHLFGRGYRRHDDDQARPRRQRLRARHPNGRRHVHLLDRLSDTKPLWPGGDPVYRGTEPATLGNWLGDAEVGSESSTCRWTMAHTAIKVHGGFHRNVRATWSTVLRELTLALQGRSLANPDETSSLHSKPCM